MAIAISPDFASDRTVFAGVPGGILRSFDGGENWDVVQLPSPPPVVSALVISPDYVRDGILLAGTVEDGVFSTSNRGGHWVAWNFGLLDLNTICLAISPDFARDETLFVGVDSGIFRSTNGGRAWREVDFPLELAPVLSLALSPAYAEDGILFAGTESHGLYRSEDRGRTWTRLGEDIVRNAVNAILLSPEFPEKADVLVMLGDGLLLSRDGGQSWSEWGSGVEFGEGLACVAAPLGLDPDAPSTGRPHRWRRAAHLKLVEKPASSKQGLLRGAVRAEFSSFLLLYPSPFLLASWRGKGRGKPWTARS